MQVQGIVNPPGTSAADGTQPIQLFGKSAEAVVTELHGKWYTAAYRGKLFIGTTLIAGVTIAVNTTTAPTFTLFNPVGSGVNLELVSLDIGWPAAAASVVATILGSVSAQTPTSTTQGGVVLSNPLNASGISAGGVGLGQGKLFTAATITATTTHIPLIQASTVTDTMNPAHVDFDGRILLAPGTLMALTSTPVQTAVAMPALAWAEWAI